MVIFSETHSEQLLGEAGMCLYLLLKCSHELEGGFGGNFKNIFIYFWLLALGLRCFEQVFFGCSEWERLSSCGAQALGTRASAAVMQVVMLLGMWGLSRLGIKCAWSTLSGMDSLPLDHEGSPRNFQIKGGRNC